ncbi:MAG: glutamate-semialdehyde -aminomutase [Cytophagaceae bacterium]|jgi:glutamate-1-semialdehyde 2,1-aminomutase|nr:glutamate-semialdehyde -aminomutase [Cytophagaceae bacterium]
MKNYSKDQLEQFRQRAHALIPAGAHTYSKADNQFSSNAPAFIERGSGASCFDYQGNEFVDYGMGIFSVSLGHAYPEVIEKITQQLAYGNSFTRPSLLEGEFAEQLCDLIPSAEMVKFAKNGSDVTSAAIRLARAYTGKEYIIRIREQPFHSFDDWFIGSTSRPGGIPDNIKSQTISASYNNIEELQSLFDQYPNQIACLLMEPVTFDEPKDNYLQKVRELCTKKGTLLIFDEIITGFRWHLKGAQHFFGITPDISTFGKGMSNGFPCAAIVGKKEIMQLGNMNGPVFLLSCTYGSELTGLTAAMATLDVFKKEPVIENLWSYGKQLIEGISQQIEFFHLHPYVRVRGYACRPDLSFHEEDGRYSFALKTLFIQEMVKHKVLMERICISYSHREKELQQTLEGIHQTFRAMKTALETHRVRESIVGAIVQPVFRF